MSLAPDLESGTQPDRMTRPDVGTRVDVHDLVVEFYREIVNDDLLGPVFGEVAQVDWAEHIPTLIDYWCRILLDEPGPPRPITSAHRRLQELAPVQVEHCDRWWNLWCASIDARWSGPTADRARNHAASMMSGMAKHIFGVLWTPPDPA